MEVERYNLSVCLPFCLQGLSQGFEKGGENNHDYITIIMLKVLQWMNGF